MALKDPQKRLIAQRLYRESRPEAERERMRRYREKYREKIAADAHARRLREPEKYRARDRLRKAAERGWIERPEGKKFHHPDYSRPYYGCWVTHREHQRIHSGLLPCPPCIDYAPQVEKLRDESLRIARRRRAAELNAKRWGTPKALAAFSFEAEA